MLQALKHLKGEAQGVELWIVGGRPVKDTLFQRQIRALVKGLPVRFFPFIPSDRVHRYYLASDLFVCPSQLPESFGMVNIEAAATGIPSLGSDAWGLKESIAEGVSGWRVKNFRSSFAWAEKLRSLLKNRSRWEKMGRSARKWAVQSFAWRRVAGEFAKLYRSLLDEKACQPSKTGKTTPVKTAKQSITAAAKQSS